MVYHKQQTQKCLVHVYLHREALQQRYFNYFCPRMLAGSHQMFLNYIIPVKEDNVSFPITLVWVFHQAASETWGKLLPQPDMCQQDNGVKDHPMHMRLLKTVTLPLSTWPFLSICLVYMQNTTICLLAFFVSISHGTI